MNKYHTLLFLLLLIVLLFLASCQQLEQEVPKEKKDDLSKIQQTACEAADRGNTCDTKLKSIAIITKEECCSKYGKCC